MRNMDESHPIHFARVNFRNDDRIFGIKDEDRFLHVYVIGKTGTGKSTLIETMALQDLVVPVASPSHQGSMKPGPYLSANGA